MVRWQYGEEVGALIEAKRLRWHIFDLEHELGIGGHNDGYNCMLCWQLEEESTRITRGSNETR